MSENTNAGDLWCMHIQGPDDVHAAPDFWTALAWATELNAFIVEKATAGNWKADDNYPLSQAVVRRWEGAPESHAVLCEIEVGDRAEHAAKQKRAALSAQSTGSGGVAAEPVAWLWDLIDSQGWPRRHVSLGRPTLTHYVCSVEPLFKHPPVAAEPVAWALELADAFERSGKTLFFPEQYPVGYPTGWDAAHRECAKDLRHAANYPPVVAAPTPPAGGGETEAGDLGTLRKALGDLAELTIWMSGSADFSKEGVAGEGWRKMKPALDRALDMLAAPIINRSPSPASPAGDLNSLSAGAAPGPWAVRQLLSDKGVAYEECFITDERSNLATGVDRAEAEFIVALVNAYRSGRLVEAAPAAPRKGPSEEEIARIIAKEVFRSGAPRGALGDAINAAAREIALLTPADRGETQAVGDGLGWAVSCWQAGVANRPLRNVHRRSLDTTWRQVVRHFGGDPDSLLGPSHDDLANDPSPDQNRGEPDQGGANTEAGR